MKVGIVGCGRVTELYRPALQQLGILEVRACADLDAERARAFATVLGARACSTAELLASDIDVVLNLTPPAQHAEVTHAALEAGKHVYSEKPLAIDREDARALLDHARASGLRLGCAPDTFLGPAWQTARVLVDDGAIGEPVAARASMLCRGHEPWHPDPAFFYAPGGGPLLDMGPYYLTVLVVLLGPVRRVTAAARASFAERTATSRARSGERIPVHVPTHVAGTLDFVSGAIATVTTSFDVYAEEHAVEVFGSEGTLLLEDPNHFDGDIRVARGWDKPRSVSYAWRVPGRGIGLADFVDAIAIGRAHRASSELAYHVLDVMLSMLEASEQGLHVELASTCMRPEPVGPDEVETWTAAR